MSASAENDETREEPTIHAELLINPSPDGGNERDSKLVVRCKWIALIQSTLHGEKPNGPLPNFLGLAHLICGDLPRWNLPRPDSD